VSKEQAVSGETNLDKLLRGMTATLAEGTFVFVACPDRRWPEGLTPRMIFEEAEGTTLIVREEDARRLGLPHEFPCRMITLNIHSSLEAVGFLARVASALAAAGIGVNPVAGFYHDHLFVPEGREQDALDVLAALARDT
jgi:hypothetical protein